MFDSIKKYFKNNILGYYPTSQPALTFRRIQYRFKYPFGMQDGVMRDINLYAREGKVSHKWFPFIKFQGFGTASSHATGYPLCKKDLKELQQNVATQSVMLNEVKQVQTSTDRATLTNQADNKTNWPGEVPQSSRNSGHTPNIITIPVNVMLISLTAGNAALEDPTFSIRDEFLEAASEAIAVTYDQLVIYGDGQGKLSGLFRRDKEWKEKDYQLFYTDKRYSKDFITVVESKPLAADFQKLVDILPPKYRANAKWLMNSNTGLYLAGLKDEKGDYVIDQTLPILQTVGVPDNYLGLPIVYNEYMDDVGIAGNAPVFLGDYKKAYTVAKRDAVSLRRFVDATYAELDQMLLLGRARIGGEAVDNNAYRVMRIQPAFENEVIITPEPIIHVNVDVEGTNGVTKEQIQKMADAIVEAVGGDTKPPVEPIAEAPTETDVEVKLEEGTKNGSV